MCGAVTGMRYHKRSGAGGSLRAPTIASTSAPSHTGVQQQQMFIYSLPIGLILSHVLMLLSSTPMASPLHHSETIKHRLSVFKIE